jgi:hypothetical protein
MFYIYFRIKVLRVQHESWTVLVYMLLIYNVQNLNVKVNEGIRKKCSLFTCYMYVL